MHVEHLYSLAIRFGPQSGAGLTAHFSQLGRFSCTVSLFRHGFLPRVDLHV